MRDLGVKDGEFLVIFKNLLLKVGLPVQEVTSMVSSSIDRNLKLGAIFSIDINLNDPSTSHPFLKALQKIDDNLYNSELVKDANYDLEQKLKMANLSSDELLERIKELEKYKIHYEMTLNMKRAEHGLGPLDGSSK